MLRLFAPALAPIVVSLFFAIAARGSPSPARPAGAEPDRAVIQPTRTSIYVGSVTLTTRPFTRHKGVFTADYQAKVFPFFFFDEHGTISIDFSDTLLRRLHRGETVHFKGHATTSNGHGRRIDGRAVPAAAGSNHGKIKVRVWVGRIELIFNSTYRLTAPRQPPA